MTSWVLALFVSDCCCAVLFYFGFGLFVEWLLEWFGMVGFDRFGGWFVEGWVCCDCFEVGFALYGFALLFGFCFF